MTTTACLAATLLAVLSIPFVILLWLLEARPARARRLRSYGWSQARIAERLGVSRYRVRGWLAA
jgi:ParB-like chromosome segregation protein Spo0J